MSPQEKFISVYGESGQADRLINAKKLNQSNPGSPLIGARNASTGLDKTVSPFYSSPQGKNSGRNLTPGSSKIVNRSPFL